jgi:hypothetical protein
MFYAHFSCCLAGLEAIQCMHDETAPDYVWQFADPILPIAMTILNTERACKRNRTETCESVFTWYQLAPGGGGGSTKSSRRGWNVSYGSGTRIWWVQLGMVTECTKNGCHMVKQRMERCMQLHWCTRLNTARNRPLNLGCYILLTVDFGQIFACSLAQSQPSSRFFIYLHLIRLACWPHQSMFDF